MRAKHQKHNHSRKGLLRRAIAVGMAAAMIYTTALSCSALEMKVVDDATDLPEEVEFTEFDEDTTDEEDTLDLVENELTPDDADDNEEVDTPEDADEVLDDAEEPDTTDEEEEEPDKSDEGDSKEEDAAKDEISSDEEYTADDEDFIDIGMLDEDEGEGEIALYAVPDNSITEAYYYDSDDETDSGDKDRSSTSAFYSDEAHNSKIVSGITMQEFIKDYCASGATITMQSRYYVRTGTNETWSNITLRRPKDRNAVRIYGELTLDYGLTIDVPSDNKTGTGATLVVKSGGTLNIKDNAVVKGCNDTAGQQGGVIYMIQNGTINMEGGTLEGARVGDRGGAVYMSAGTFTMSGGTITDCQAQYGAGVYMAGGTFTMSDSAKISGNKVSGAGAYGGGGVCVNSGTFTMSGGIIGKNDGARYGGGILINGGNVVINGGLITGNKSNGAAAISKPSGTLIINGGTVADNTWDGTSDPNTNEVGLIGNMTIDGGSVKRINQRENNGNSVKNSDNVDLVRYVVSDLDINQQYNNMTISYLYDGVNKTYSCDGAYADSEGCMYPWLPKGSIITGATKGKVNAPQISIAVPVSLTVLVKPDGECIVQCAGSKNVTVSDEYSVQTTTLDNIETYAEETNGSIIKNNSTVPIYLVKITFTWNAEGSQTDNGEAIPAPSAIFTNWSVPPTIKLNNKDGVQIGDTITWTFNNGKIDANKTFNLNWSFDLMGNSISQELQADTLAPIGTIMYTVSYQDPSKTGSTAA